MNNGGDVLARGAGSAQFAAGGSKLTDFEADFIYKDVADICTKYGLTQEEYDTYQAARDKGEKLPDLQPMSESGTLEVGFSVNDRRSSYTTKQEVKPVEAKPKKFPDPSYEPLTTLMDRILVMVISDDPNVELLEDGSTRDKTSGLITAAKYKQHSKVGIILLGGQWVITGGVKTPMGDIVKPGDKVIYGDYGSEVLPMTDEKAEALCDSIGVNYEKTEQGLRIVRIQDVRSVERRKVPTKTLEQFVAEIPENPYLYKKEETTQYLDSRVQEVKSE